MVAEPKTRFAISKPRRTLLVAPAEGQSASTPGDLDRYVDRRCYPEEIDEYERASHFFEQ